MWSFWGHLLFLSYYSFSYPCGSLLNKVFHYYKVGFSYWDIWAGPEHLHVQLVPKSSVYLVIQAQYSWLISLLWPQERTMFHNCEAFSFSVWFCLPFHKILYRLIFETTVLHKKEPQKICVKTKNNLLLLKCLDGQMPLILVQLTHMSEKLLSVDKVIR